MEKIHCGFFYGRRLKFLQNVFLKTDTPFRANFRRIKQGGIPIKFKLYKNVCTISFYWLILFFRKVFK